MQRDGQNFRDREFERVFFDELRNGESVKEAYRNAIRHKASCFFASVRYAAKYIRRREAGQKPDIRNNITRKMYDDIYTLYAIEKASCPEKTMYEIIERVINSPAPRFYISLSRARHIIRKLRNERRRDNRGKRNA